MAPQSSRYQCKFQDAKQMAEYVATQGVELVDCVFADPLGLWHHCTFAPSQMTEEDIKAGLPFDGSSIRLFTRIMDSDMVMIPDPSTCWIDPFAERKTLHTTCSISNPVTKQGYVRDPRSVAQRCGEYMKTTGIADTCVVGPEAEFFIFDSVRLNVSANSSSYEVDGEEGYWNNQNSNVGNSAGANLGHRMPIKQSYFPTAPIDTTAELRSEMLCIMGEVGIPVEKHHHEVATCQCELGFTCRPMVECADMLMTYKYITKNVAKKFNKTATFMPKPLYGDNGSGCHVHQSLWKDGKPLFFDENGKYVKLSQTAMWYIGGILKHAPAICAFTNPSTNSYKRLVPGYEAPVNLAMSKGNRSAAIRIPMYKPDDPKQKRLEFRCPDPSCCPYLAFAAMCMAGIDGVLNKIEPPPPADFDIFELSAAEKEKLGMRSTPAHLGEAIDALEADYEFLVKGNVFDVQFIKDYIKWKRNEFTTVNIMPHPKEFELYYAC